MSSTEHEKEGSLKWFFLEFWPIIFFGSLFVVMFALPLVMAGNEAHFAPSGTAFVIGGLGIVAAFLVGLLVTFVIPWLIGPYLLVLAAILFFMVPGAFARGTTIVLVFSGFCLLGSLFFPNAIFGTLFSYKKKK